MHLSWVLDLDIIIIIIIRYVDLHCLAEAAGANDKEWLL